MGITKLNASKELKLNEVANQYKKKWKCPECGDYSNYLGYCKPCDDKRDKKKIFEDCMRMHLSGLEKYFSDKYGPLFSMEDFKIDSETHAKEQAKVKSLVINYIESIKSNKNNIGLLKKKGLGFYGYQGTGKSMLSNLIQFEMNKLSFSTLRSTQFDIYQDVLKHGSVIAVEKYTYPDFLFIDEIGRLNKTDNAYHVFFNLINKRYSSSKQTVFTTNLGKEIYEFLDQDRLKEFIKVGFMWESHRGKDV
jgi:DNA replication protein DnaC